ncbi:MAG: hypothetical protein HQM10_03655 [Candidatus Riflebacteria bacterium]|nr:hypothetical protein [Candidatus Riflebacteria bacterium]
MRSRGFIFRCTFLIAFSIVLSQCVLFAQNTVLSGSFLESKLKMKENLRYVPFTSLENLLSGKNTGFIIPQNVYEKMKEEKDAYLAKGPHSPIQNNPNEITWTKASYSGKVKNRAGYFQAEYGFEIPQERWVCINLPGGDIALEEVILDGKPVGVIKEAYGGIQDNESPRKRILSLQRQFSEKYKSDFKKAPRRTVVNNDFSIIVKEKGFHTLKIKFQAASHEDPEKNELTFKIPRIPINVFQIDLEKSGFVGEVDRSEGCRTEDSSSGISKVSGILGTTDRFTLRWAPKNISMLPDPAENKQDVPQPENQIAPNQTQTQTQTQTSVQVPIPPKPVEPPRILVDSFSLVSFGEGFIRNHSFFRLNITRSSVGLVNFRLPAGSVILDCKSEKLDTFSAENSSDSTILKVRMNSKISGRIDVVILSETKMPDVSGEVDAPMVICENAERTRGFLGIEARTSIEIQKKEISAKTPADESLITPIDPSEAPEEIKNMASRPILQAYRFQEPSRFRLLLEIIRHTDIPVLTSIADSMTVTTILSQDENTYYCLDLMIKNNGNQYLELKLASDSQIISASMEGSPIKALSPGGDRYLVPLLNQKTRNIMGKPFNIRVVYRTQAVHLNKAQWLQLPLPKIGMTVSEVTWQVYAPEGYSIVPIKASFDPRRPSASYFPVYLGNSLFGSIFSAGAGVFVIFILFGYLAYGRMLSLANSEWSMQSKFFTGLAIFFVIFVSLPYFMQSSRSTKQLFDTIEGTLSAPMYEMESKKSENRSYSRQDMNYAPHSGKELMGESEEQSDVSAPSAAMGGAIGMQKSSLDSLGIKEKRAPMAIAPKLNRSKSRDQGALPVEMKLPMNGIPAVVFKRILLENETAAFYGVAFWAPVWTLVPYILNVIGLILFIILLLFSVYRRSYIASMMFFVLSIALVILEDIFPGIEFPIIVPFIIGLFVTLLVRIFSYIFLKQPAVAKKSAVAIFVLALLFSSNSVFASSSPTNNQNEVSAPLTEPPMDVFFLYNQMGDRISSDSGLVFLSNEQYKFLKDLGIPEPDPKRLLPPYSSGIISGKIDGIVKGDQIDLKAVFEVELYGKGFKRIPFPALNSGLKSLRIDGEEAFFALGNNIQQMNQQQVNQGDNQQYQQLVQERFQLGNNAVQNNFIQPDFSENCEIWTEKEGRITIEAIFVKDLFSKNDPNVKAEGFSIPLPNFAIMKFDLILDRVDQIIDIKPGLGIDTVSLATGTRVVGLLQPSPLLRVEWRDAVEEKIPAQIPQAPASTSVSVPVPVKPVEILKPRLFTDHEIIISSGDGFISISDYINVQIESEPVGEFVFSLPSGCEVLEVSCADLSSWKVSQNAAGNQELKVLLNTRRLQPFSINLDMEIPVSETSGEFKLNMPALKDFVPHGTIEREKGFISFDGREGFEISISDATDATRVDPQEIPASMRDRSSGFVLYAFKYIKTPNISLKVTKHQDVTVSTAQIDGASARTLITDDGKTLTRVDLTVRNNNNQFLLIQNMPEGMKLVSAEVNYEPVKPGLGKTGEINVPLIRSPRQNKEFAPFCTSLTFEKQLSSLDKFGKIELELPNFSFDISQMRWEIDAPEKFYLVKRSGPFSADEVPSVFIPGSKLDQGALGAGQSNVMQSQVMTKARVNEAPAADSSASGLFPVDFFIPLTSNRQYFGRRLISATSAAPSIKFYFARESVVLPILLAVSLLAGFILVKAVILILNRSFFRGMIIICSFFAFLIGLEIIQGIFGKYLVFIGRFISSGLDGTGLALLFTVSWFILSGDIPRLLTLPEENSQPKPPAEPINSPKPGNDNSNDKEKTPPPQ